jgi:hypothetical protein
VFGNCRFYQDLGEPPKTTTLRLPAPIFSKQRLWPIESWLGEFPIARERKLQQYALNLHFYRYAESELLSTPSNQKVPVVGVPKMLSGIDMSRLQPYDFPQMQSTLFGKLHSQLTFVVQVVVTGGAA